MLVLEPRIAMAYAGDPCLFCDVHPVSADGSSWGDGEITPSDALSIINRINLEGVGPVPSTERTDVNFDGFVSSSDVLCVINWLNREPDAAVILDVLIVSSDTYGLTPVESLAAIKDGLTWFEQFDVGLKYIDDGPADLIVETTTVYVGGGVHAGGRFSGGNRIELHNGFLPAGTHSGRLGPGDQHTQVFSVGSLGKVTVHEAGHRWGLRHSGDLRCIMHSNAAATDFCLSENVYFQGLFGGGGFGSGPPVDDLLFSP